MARIRQSIFFASAVGALALSQHSLSMQRMVGEEENNDAVNTKEDSHGEPFSQKLDNHDDMQYTGVINVGGQELNAIYDTGSFELLVFSSRCTACGEHSVLFDQHKSKSFMNGNLVTEHSFGSGTTESSEAYVDVQIGSMMSSGQVFWEVVSAEMPVLSEASFQAILGVGPPASAVDMAQEDADAAREQYENHGTKDEEQDMKHYANVVRHARNATSLAANMNIKTFSFCLEKPAGGDGWFVWNDMIPRERPAEMFRIVPVVGDFYWSAKLTDVKLGVMSGSMQPTWLGCRDQECSAVMDSGTSLISAPDKVVDMIEDILAKRATPEGDCSDLTGLPEFEFKINGESFSLPPSSYVGEIDDVVSSDLVKLMPHLRNREKRKGCVPVLMTLDADSQFGALWVFGMPFFRKYYSTFHFEENDSPRPAGKTMAFSAHDGSCVPKPTSFLRTPTDTSNFSPLRFNVSKVNVPRWVTAAQKKGRIHL